MNNPTTILFYICLWMGEFAGMDQVKQAGSAMLDEATPCVYEIN